MSVMAVRVQERGQVTIPLKIRRKLKLEKGNMVVFVETKDGVMLVPVEVVASQALDQIGQALKGEGLSLDELIEQSRELRYDLIIENDVSDP